jgi:hypothetical protein
MTTTTTATIINLYEDNAGNVYLERDGEAWVLGPVAPDMHGSFAQDAAGWVDGTWEPSEDTGQSRVDYAGLLADTQIEEAGDATHHIAMWSSTRGVMLKLNAHGEPVAGAGGRAYLGIES